MKWFATYKGTGETVEISKEKALDIVLGSYKDNDMTRDWLTIVNRIPCRFSTVWSKREGEEPLKEGVYCEIPEEAEYDDNFNRIVKS